MKKTYAHIVKNKFLLRFCNLVLLLVIESETKAQQSNNWYFFQRAGITFNTNPPSVLSDGQSETFGSATMSDENGQLIFYSDATKVWNRLQQIMPNGDSLFGSGSVVGSNYSTTIQSPNNPNLYYLFLAEAYSSPPSGYSGYFYCTIDKSLNGGLGGLVEKNKLISRPSGEKMTTAQHANGLESWLVTLERGNLIYNTFKIGCNGIAAIPIKDTFELHNASDSFYYIEGGDMKTSFQNDKIAACFSMENDKRIELYKFDNLTGRLRNRIKLTTDVGFGNYFFDIAFSKNGKYLYATGVISSGGIEGLYRYNIDIWDSATIQNSRVLIATSMYSFLGLQFGPDDNLYIAALYRMHQLKNPDAVNPIFVDNYLNLFPGGDARFLPKFASNLISNQNVQINYTVAPNCRTVTLKGQTYIQGRNLAFKWQFGDGDSVLQNVVSGDTTFTTVTHTYSPGTDTFSVSLTVTSDTVCGFGRAGKQVYLKPPPPTALFGSNAGCGSLTIQFTDSTLLNFNPSITHQWAYRKAGSNAAFINFSALQNPAFAFPAFDSFSVRLIVTSPLSCVASDTIIKTIRLKPKPIAAFTPAGSCGNKTIAFTNNSTLVADTISSYHWRFANEGISTLKNPSFTFNNFGSYPIKLSVTSSLGCVSDTFGLSVTVADKPVANIIYNNDACANASFNLSSNTSVQAGTINGYNWLLQDVPAGSLPSISPVLSAGDYTVKHWVSSSNGCSSDTAQQLINVQANPVAGINAPDGCVGTPIPFTATNITGNATTVKWFFGNGDSSNQAAPNYTYLQPGNFNISFTAGSSNGCKSNVATKNIVIETNPGVNFTTDDLCAGKRINFVSTAANTAGNITNYTWAFGNDSTAAIPSAFTTFNRPGTYSVTHTAATINGCTTSAIQNLFISNLPVSAGNDVTINQNTPYQLQGSGNGSYLWQPAQFLNNPAITNPFALLQKDQLFTLQLTASNGCKGFDSVLIKVLGKIFIPSAFSPNGDTYNDTWRIQRLADYPSAKLSVFNRYGQIIFEGSNNNGYAWDGKYKGQLQPTGAYVYVLQVNDGKANQTFRGTVMLVR